MKTNAKKTSRSIVVFIAISMLLVGNIMLLTLQMIDMNIVQVFAAGDVNSGKCGNNLNWVLDNAGTLTISGSGDMYDNTTDLCWSSYKNKIKKIVISEGVTNIGSKAFYDCSVVTSVNIPASVINIGEGIFNSCSKLNSIKVDEKNKVYDSRNNCNAILTKKDSELIAGCKNTIIPDDTSRIGNYAFGGIFVHDEYDSLEDLYNSILKEEPCVIKIPDNVKSIGKRAFAFCDDLDYVDISEKVESIEDEAFVFCSDLRSMYISKGVKNIGETVFNGCTQLKSIKVDVENKIYDSRNECNAIIKKDGNVLIFGCANTIIPEGVEKIGAYSFSGCYNLKSINVPNKVTSIEKGAFSLCFGLERIELPSSIVNISENNFDCSVLTIYGVPGSYVESYARNNNIIFKEKCSQHSYDSGKVNFGATCTEKGEMKYECLKCGNIDKREIPAEGHNVVIDKSISATCTSSGKSEGSHCSKCNMVVKEQKYIPLLDHKWDSGKVTKEPTTTSEGVKTYTCTACNVTKMETLAKKKQEIVSEKTEAQKAEENKTTGWVKEENGENYWYEEGKKQGVQLNNDGTIDETYRGKEIYDPSTDGWYWLDNVTGGTIAKSKDVYQESFAGNWGDIINEDGSRNGKWVRYDAQGKMVKGWCQGAGADAKVIENSASATEGQPVYYFDQIYGTMAKGYATVDGVEYYFNPFTGVLERTVTEGLAGFTGWKNIGGVDFWYEEGNRQGTSSNTSYRGKEIFDPGTNAWYWLDNVDAGKKAVSKDVYQDSLAGDWGDIVKEDGQKYGKWVRYDAEGHMIKGWSAGYGETARTINNPEESNSDVVYYFDPVFGTMAKGLITVDGVDYYFDRNTGTLIYDSLTSNVPQVDGIVPFAELSNYENLRGSCSDKEFEKAYVVALEVVRPLVGKSKKEQLEIIAKELRIMADSGKVRYSTTEPHFNEAYGYFVAGVASCAGCTRATGLCLNMLGIEYEHVNQSQWTHQWCRVDIDGVYYICDAYGLYCGPEPAPYEHPNIKNDN